jgi:hypothetical protein
VCAFRPRHLRKVVTWIEWLHAGDETFESLTLRNKTCRDATRRSGGVRP